MNPTDNNIQYCTGSTSMVQADSPVTQPVYSATKLHQCTIARGTATVGTATLTACPVGSAVFEPVYDKTGTAIVYNAATSPAQATYPDLPGRMISFKWTLAGGNGTFLYSFAGQE